MPKEYYDEHIVVKADTLGELAEKCKINKSNLEETVKQWNEYSKDGKDLEWRRGDSIYDKYVYSYIINLLNTNVFYFTFVFDIFIFLVFLVTEPRN